MFTYMGVYVYINEVCGVYVYINEVCILRLPTECIRHGSVVTICMYMILRGCVPCSVLRCVVVCCNVLQCGAAWCSVVQCLAGSCSVLQCVAVWCSVLQCVAVCCALGAGHAQRACLPIHNV